MKPRRVIVTLEIDTEASLVDLKNKWRWRAAWNKYHSATVTTEVAMYLPPIVVDQVSVNVVKQPKPRKKSK